MILTPIGARVLRVSFMFSLQPMKGETAMCNADTGSLSFDLYYSPANAEAASLYRENMKEYVRRVKSTVEESWMDEGEGPSGEAGDEDAPTEGAAAAAA